jgi:Flp pilus assembly protein TadB
LVGFGIGVLVAVLTGWLVAVLLVPAAVAGLPVLLSAPPAASQIERLEAMEEWTRSLSGVLTVGIGLEEALVATLRSAPDSIRPEVTRLVARLRARWSTEEALRMFADDLDDATGDLVAANLILAARRRGAGVASVLESLAESVAADVRARRAIEADRAKPRATARWVTLITIGVLAVLALTGSYITPYSTPLGEMILVLLLSSYVATLATGKPLPRFIRSTPASTRPGHDHRSAAGAGRRRPARSGRGIAAVAIGAGSSRPGRRLAAAVPGADPPQRRPEFSRG